MQGACMILEGGGGLYAGGLYDIGGGPVCRGPV